MKIRINPISVTLGFLLLDSREFILFFSGGLIKTCFLAYFMPLKMYAFHNGLGLLTLYS